MLIRVIPLLLPRLLGDADLDLANLEDLGLGDLELCDLIFNDFDLLTFLLRKWAVIPYSNGLE